MQLVMKTAKQPCSKDHALQQSRCMVRVLITALVRTQSYCGFSSRVFCELLFVRMPVHSSTNMLLLMHQHKSCD